VDETAQKAKNVYYKYFLEFILASINGLEGFVLPKKNLNCCTLLNIFRRKWKDLDPEPDPEPYL
jgi:hypothetical protein